MSEDLSHDAHLRAALRHAPDHALAPPAGVSQTILNAARHVHKPARPAATPTPPVRITIAPPRPIAWLRQWFASPRLAGGLATGLVAALGLGLWMDLGREPVIDRPSPEAAREMHRPDASPAAPVPAPGGTSTDDIGARQPSPPPAARADAARPKRSADPPAKAEQNTEPAQWRTPTAPSLPAERREDPVVARRSVDELAQPTPHAPASPPAAAAPSPDRSAELARDVADATKAAAPAAVDAQQRDAAARSDMRMSSAAGRAAAVAGARAPTVDGANAAEAAAAASPAIALHRRMRSETATGQARWTWMPPGKATIAPVDEAALAWLGRVVQASRARWADTNERSGSGDALEVRWWRDDWPQATLRIEGDGLRWIEHSGRLHHAPLDLTALQRLRSP